MTVLQLYPQNTATENISPPKKNGIRNPKNCALFGYEIDWYFDCSSLTEAEISVAV